MLQKEGFGQRLERRFFQTMIYPLITLVEESNSGVPADWAANVIVRWGAVAQARTN